MDNTTYKLNNRKNVANDDTTLYISLKSLPFYRRIFAYWKLPKNDKQRLKKYLAQKKDNIANEKTDFNPEHIFEVDNLNLWYSNGKQQALFNININIKKNKVTALIGPSGCGKSTFLRNLNRINDETQDIIVEGNIYYNGQNTRSKKLSALQLRSEVGMIFQKPSPFAMSIYDNVAYGPKSHGITDKKVLDKIVEQSLQDAALYDEVKDDLNKLGTDLSGGQQQRLCIARVLAMNPEVILMDEPTSALDPIATTKIEDLVFKLKKKYTIIIVTHSMSQAQRISDDTAFFYKGQLIEFGTTRQVFTKPKNKLTNNYILGKMS